MAEGGMRTPAGWRTPTAIALASAVGVPIGIFAHMCAAVPFGPVLTCWLVALVGGFAVSAALGVLATHRYTKVGLGYAASVAMTVVIASDGGGWSDKAFQFAIIFSIVGCTSASGSVLCGLLKWEDERARESTKRSERTRHEQP